MSNISDGMKSASRQQTEIMSPEYVKSAPAPANFVVRLIAKLIQIPFWIFYEAAEVKTAIRFIVKLVLNKFVIFLSRNYKTIKLRQ